MVDCILSVINYQIYKYCLNYFHSRRYV